MSDLATRLAACESNMDRVREQRIDDLAREIESLGMCQRARMLALEIKRLVRLRPTDYVARLEKRRGLR